MNRIIFLILFPCTLFAQASYGELYTKLTGEFQIPRSAQVHFLKQIESVADTCKAAQEPMECLKKEIYQVHRIVFDSTSKKPLALFPNTALQEKRGDCVPLTFLVLIAAEKMNISASAVALPGHVFVRYGDNLNWEPNRGGFRYQNEDYETKYALNEALGRTMQTLSLEEFEGLFRYEVAGRYAATGDFKRAEREYKEATRLWKDPRIPGNLALLLTQTGREKRALEILDSLWFAGVQSEELVWNKLILMMALEISPRKIRDFSALTQNLGISSPRLNDLRRKLGTFIRHEN